MTTISKHAVPRVSYRVRRRHYDATRWLVQQNDWYELDELTDAVWTACEQGLTVEEIILRVARDQNLPLREAVAYTAYTLERFRMLGLLDYGD